MPVPSGLCRLAPALLAVLLVAGCGGGGGRQVSTRPALPQPAEPFPQATLPPPVPVETRKPAVGLLLPLSGRSAKLGADFLDAAQLALFDVGDTTLELIPRDTGDQPDKAVTAANEAIDAGAELLLGPLFGPSTSAVAPAANARGISLLSFSNDASVARPGVWVMGFRPEEQVERVVGYAARRGATRFAALVPANAYGNLTIDAWRRAVGRTPGATAVAVERYEPDQGDPSSAVQRLASLGGRVVASDATPASADPATIAPPAPSQPPAFDALLVADRGQRLRTVANSLAFYNLGSDVTSILGTMLWQEEPAVMSEPALRGAWLAARSPDALDGFNRRFQAAYGRTPAPLAVLAYDATALAALLAGSDRRFTPDQLTDPQGFSGGSGIFRLRNDGLTEHALAIVEAGAGPPRVIDPAPTSFAGGLAQR